MVEVTNDDLERAIRKMKRRLKDDNGIKLLRERQYFRKPSELKVLARKERDKRIGKKTFRAELKWITARQARELGIGIVPYSQVEELSDTDFRRLCYFSVLSDELEVAVPFFQGENLEKNKVLLTRVAKIAEAKKCTTSQLALAWVIKKGAPTTVPIPGTTKIANLEANIGALGVELTDAEMKALEEAVPATDIAGTRYADATLKFTWQHSNSPPLSSWKDSASA